MESKFLTNVGNFLSRFFGSKEPVNPPYLRAVITFPKASKYKGTENDSCKVIRIIEGNELKAEYPYDKILAENIEKVEKIPVDDLTEPSPILIKQEIDPADIKFRK